MFEKRIKQWLIHHTLLKSAKTKKLLHLSNQDVFSSECYEIIN